MESKQKILEKSAIVSEYKLKKINGILKINIYMILIMLFILILS